MKQQQPGIVWSWEQSAKCLADLVSQILMCTQAGSSLSALSKRPGRKSVRWADQAEKSEGGFSIGGTAALQVRRLHMQVDWPYHWKRFIKYSPALAIF